MRNKVTRRISSICLIFCMLLVAFFADGSLSDIFSEIIGVNAVFADTGESSDEDTSDAYDASENGDTASADTSTDDILGKITVYSGGEAVTAASFGVAESVTLTAEYSGEGGNYSWQIYDSSQTTWFDISGQTAAEIRVGYAMVASMLDEKDAAYVRCKVTDGDLLYYSDVITLCVDIQESGSTYTSAATGSSAATSASSNSDNIIVCANDLPRVTSSGSSLLTYTIEVEYVYYTGSTAYNSYVANVMDGGTLITTVTSPTIVGYTPYIDVTDTETEDPNETCIYSYLDSDNDVHYVYGTDASTVTLNYTAIDEDDTIKVTYYPSTVNYTVLHYVQNILNDDYVLYKTETKTGYVGASIEITDLTDADSGDAEMNGGGYICVSGSDSSTIAADGSTMIYVYYDRVYYVMTFDLAGGSGVSPIYAKYGTPVSVSDPVRTGYTFAGWYDEADSTQTLLASDELPDTIPAEKKSYVATWTPAQTTYTVVYWRENANDDDYSYWCQTTVTAITNSTIDLDDIYESYELESVTTVTTTGIVYSGSIGSETQFFLGNAAGVMVTSITDESGTLSMPMSSSVSDYSSLPIFTITSTGESNAYYISYESDGVTYYLQFTNFGSSSASLNSTTDISKATVWYYTDTNGNGVGFYCKNSATTDTNTYYLANDDNFLRVKTATSKIYLYGIESTTEVDDDDLAYFTYNETKTEDSFTTTTVAADGSTVVNVYYSRNSYTLRFFFARMYESTWYISTATDNGWFFRVFAQSTKNVNTIQTITGTLGSAKSLTIDSSNVSTYATMAGVSTDDVYLGTYYYVELTAKYNKTISTIWPLAVGDVSDSENTTDQNMILDTQEVAKGSSYYKFVSWGTQENSTYWSTHSNKNIKGPYSTMSAELIENTNSDGTYVTSSQGSAHDLMAYYATGPDTYTYEIYLQNTDGTYSSEPTYSNAERSTDYGNGQNPYSYEGFTIITENTTITEVDADNGTSSSVTISPDSGGRVYVSGSSSATTKGGTIKFYYSRDKYTLSYYNINEYIEDEKTDVYYGVYLSGYEINSATMLSDYYPTTLVEGVYEFGGWYTTADCLDGTEVSSTTTMPASNLVLYAKWIPKTYDVSVWQTSNLTSLVYYLADDGAGGTTTTAMQWLNENDEGLDYGESLPDAVQDSGPLTDAIAQNRSYTYLGEEGKGEIEEDWIFVCWAYQKDGVEYALDVSSFTVFGDVNIYAKWTSNTLLSYKITYAEADLYVDNDGNIYDKEGGNLLKFDSSGNLYYINGDGETVYPTISAKTTTETDADGNAVTTDVYIADATTGYLYEGANRTFSAKTGTGLYEAYQSGYYPLTSSHSVLMVDEDNDGVVTYVFYYIKTSPVTYSVYFEDANGNSMFDVATHSYDSTLEASYQGKTTSSSVVTENYLYFSGYTVDAVQKTLVLSANEAENVITFVYTKSDNAPYTVNYYYEVWFADGSVGSYDLAVTDGNTTRYYRLYTTESGTVDLGGTFNVSTNWSIAGYEYVYHDVYHYSWNGTDVDAGTATTYPDTSGNTTDYGTTITVDEVYGALANVFYNLKTYPYIVYHKYLDSGDNVIAPVEGTAAYTSEVTAEALTDDELNAEGIYGYTVDTSQKSTTITITIEVEQGATPTVNVITFYYYEKSVTYQYKTMLQYSSGSVTELNDSSSAVLSLESENVKVKTGTTTGSVAYYDSIKYEFVGWYLDEDCTIQLTTEGVADDTDPTQYNEYSYATVSADSFTLSGASASTDTEKLTTQKVAVSGSTTEIYQTDTSLNETVNTGTVQVFYALFRLRSGTLTIIREEQDQVHYNSANSFVYTVTQTKDAYGNAVDPSDAIVITVTIDPGETSVTICDLPAGTYTVTQENNWSWRYTDSTFTVDDDPAEVTEVTIDTNGATVTFNDPYSRYWLSGFSNALTNVYGD